MDLRGFRSPTTAAPGVPEAAVRQSVRRQTLTLHPRGFENVLGAECPAP